MKKYGTKADDLPCVRDINIYISVTKGGKRRDVRCSV